MFGKILPGVHWSGSYNEIKFVGAAEISPSIQFVSNYAVTKIHTEMFLKLKYDKSQIQIQCGYISKYFKNTRNVF